MNEKILIIEDQLEVRENLAELIENEGYITQTAENGIEGITKINSFFPDLILCDIMMPKMNGYEILEYLQSKSNLASIPFIFLSAKADLDSIRQGMNIGADDYITKPFKADELLNVISKRLSKFNLVNFKLNKLKENLSISLPHELRTPLMSILGFSQLLSDNIKDLKPEEIISMAKDINAAGERLLRLTNNYLFYSELMIIKSQQPIKKFSRLICYQPESIILDVTNQFKEKPNHIGNFNLKVQSSTIKADSEYFRKIIYEALDNAVKFSYPHTDITIKGYVENNFYNIEIYNKGIGLTEEEIHSIDAFSQFNRKVLEQEGSGFGLIIIKELVSLMNGFFQIESNYKQDFNLSIKFPLSDNTLN